MVSQAARDDHLEATCALGGAGRDQRRYNCQSRQRSENRLQNGWVDVPFLLEEDGKEFHGHPRPQAKDDFVHEQHHSNAAHSDQAKARCLSASVHQLPRALRAVGDEPLLQMDGLAALAQRAAVIHEEAGEDCQFTFEEKNGLGKHQSRHASAGRKRLRKLAKTQMITPMTMTIFMELSDQVLPAKRKTTSPTSGPIDEAAP